MTDPTPATPDEAVAPMVDLLRAEFDQGHMMVMEPIAERILALSRQQGDTVAARVADEMMDWRFGPEPFAARDIWHAEAVDLARRWLGIGADGAGDGR